jgi:hypothetical protein
MSTMPKVTVILLVALCATCYAAELKLQVSPTGPIKSLSQALDQARGARQPGDTARIVVGPGTYYLAQTITLGPADSGLIIESTPGREPVISGGRRVTGWKPWKGKILQADLSKLDLPDLSFRELYYNVKMQPWARVPNFDPKHPRTGGFLQNDGLAEVGTKTKFRYAAGAVHPELWAHPERAWMMFHDSLSYETQYCPVKSVDAATRVVEAERGVYVLSPGNPFYLCGILEELDAPGEWCVDPDTKTLYFWPPSGNPNGKDQVIVPALTSAFVFQGQPAADQWVQNVRLSGLDVRDCRGRAIQMTGAKSCAVTRCDLRNAEVGVYLGDDTHACQVRGCDITATQGDGVSIIGTSKDHERVTDHVVDNCYIWDIGWGRIHNRCGGVYGHRMMRVKITHNLIHDTPRYAIGMDAGGDCEIAYNIGHHSNLVTMDTSIIEAATAMDWGLPMDEQMDRNRKYNWNNSIHHNLIHDSGGWGTNSEGKLQTPLYSWGIYLDTHSSGWQVHDNVCYNTTLGAYMVNGGMENVFENNICVDGQQHQAYLSVWPKYECRGNRVERNIFASPGKTATGYNVRKTERDVYAFDRNLLWAGGDEVRINAPSLVKKGSWEAWRALGQEEGGLVADPQFVDPAQRNYALKPTSPAFGLGFKAIDLSQVGNYASPDRRTWPRPEVKVARDETDYSPAAIVKPSQPALRTYEDYAVNEKERNAHVGEEGDLATVRVTDETAASGKQSLRVAEKPGVKLGFVPYITYLLEMEQGVLKAGFDLRWEQGALFVYEWRDDPYNYSLGPHLATDAAGHLTANGQPVMDLTPGQWVRFDITCGLGPQNTGKYGLTVKPAGGEAKTFTIAHAEKFETLNCVVVMSVTEGESLFYLDNVEFKPQR